MTRAPEGILTFYLPTLFSSDPAAFLHFKDTTGEQALFRSDSVQIPGACGYNLEPFRVPPRTRSAGEGNSCYQATSTEKFDARRPDVLAGEAKAGLHKIKGQVRPGVPMLKGSKVKAAEAEVYRKLLVLPFSIIGALLFN